MEGAYSDVSLNALFHGMKSGVQFPDAPGTHRATVDLMKDTNTVRLVLQHYDGKTLDPSDFSFTITDDNGLMNYDNSVMADETITYHEWTKRPAMVGTPGTGDADIESISSVVAEIDVARLMKGHNAVLTVTAAGKEAPVLRLPLIDLLLVAKGEARTSMSDQEYLDRQDDYTLIFFLNDQNGWYMSGGIYVNSWHVIYQSSVIY